MKMEIGKEYDVDFVDPLDAHFKILDINGDNIKIEMWVNSCDIGWYPDNYYEKGEEK